MRFALRLTLCACTLLLCHLSQSSARAAAPVIAAVQNAANYQPVIASNAWIAIMGSNLSTTTRGWAPGDFNGSNLPVQLDGVSVTINGVAAYVYFISPGQINVLGPDDATTGTVNVVVTNAQGTSSAFPADKEAVSPALFAYTAMDGHFAVIEKAPSFGLVATPGLLGPTVTTTTASPGDTLVLYTTGLGPVTPAHSAGQLVATSAATANPVTVTIGGQPAAVGFAGLVGSGLYQINVVAPPLRSGDGLIVVSVAGKPSGGSVYVPIQAYGHPSGQSTPPLQSCVNGPVDYITYNSALLASGQTVDVSIGGIQLCPTCGIKAPIYPEFTARLARALEDQETVKACYDQFGNIFQLTVTQP